MTIKRALVSVTDKTGIVDFCRALVDEFDVEVISTGGTAAVLKDAGVPVALVEETTGFPEMMDGRVKTLHPKVHGGLLARRDVEAHLEAAREFDISLIDMVVVNLYAFEATIAREGVTEAEAIENIDIGGPSMLRSAAKNFASVTVVTQPDSYDSLLEELRVNGGVTSLETRRMLAYEAFALTAAYDTAIKEYLSRASSLKGRVRSVVEQTCTDKRIAIFTITLARVQNLRYGENPHQSADLYHYCSGTEHTMADAEQLQGKELSYNNILDTDAAWTAVREFSDTTCVIVKHANPCGAASDDDIVTAYQRAWEGDPVSAYGGIIALNRTVTGKLVEAIFANKQFVEVLIAPDFDDAALELLATKPNLRVLATGGINPPGKLGGMDALTIRSVEGGVLIQKEDAVVEDPSTFTVAGEFEPSAEIREDLLFAHKIGKSVKSNAIVLVKDRQLIGMGAGQPNRVNSARIAVEQAGDAARGAVAASDAFIPFPDTMEVLATAGIAALIQPGGSIRDDEVLALADKAKVAVLFTGTRHFRH